MIPLPVAEIAAITGGTLSVDHPGDAIVTGPAVIDSRQAVPGALFAALPGERADGHDYAAAAVRNGAAAILAARARQPVMIVVSLVVAAFVVFVLVAAAGELPGH